MAGRGSGGQPTGRAASLLVYPITPLYLNHPQEAEHYDNISEPARSWLLSLLETYNVEAVFTAHSHNFFYNRYFNTDLYALPAVAFVRPDFSELFGIPPASEFGRNDVEKLGFVLVSVDEAGYHIESIRSHGLIEGQEEAIVSYPRSLGSHSTDKRTMPIGVPLRHAWAHSIEMPTDNLDEFTRKVRPE